MPPQLGSGGESSLLASMLGVRDPYAERTPAAVRKLKQPHR